MNRPVHVEAFMLMRYRSDDGTTERVIWNSRDGVTPFVITLDGVTMRHVEWTADRFAPDYVPSDDEMIFTTVWPPLEYWRSIYRNRVAQAPQYAPPEGPERDAFVEELARNAMMSCGEEGTVGLVTGATWRSGEGVKR